MNTLIVASLKFNIFIRQFFYNLSFQKEMQGVDAAFYYLANEYYKLYQDRIEVFKSLGMQ